MPLLERDAELNRLERLLAATAQRHGHCALVLGEAGIGKTALVRVLAENAAATADVLWGGCEALFTPRPLGPIADMAHLLPPGLAARVGEGHTYNGLFPALLGWLRARSRPALLVIDDAHWADEATLDCIKYLGRRIEDAPALLVITARSDELGLDHPLWRVLGELPGATTRRMELAPLSRAAIGRLAHAAGRNATTLEQLSGGNPFYLSELLADDGATIPGSVRDAVLGRVVRLAEPARRVVELVAIEPARMERALVTACLPASIDADAAIDAALASGVLRADGSSLAYRHEIARQSVESALDAGRLVELHTQVLQQLQALLPRDATLSRQVHHAHAAGLRAQVAALAPQAAAEAARVGAHREAAALYRIAVDQAPGTLEAQVADVPALLEAAACALQRADALDEAIGLREQALHLRQQRATQPDQTRCIGVNLRRLSVLHAQRSGRKGDARRYAEAAVAALEPLGASGELAKAYATLAHALYLASEFDAATDCGERANTMAEACNDKAAQVLALSTLGSTTLCRVADARARAQVEQALELAIESGFEGLAADLFLSVATLAFNYHDHAHAVAVSERGIEYCDARDLDGSAARLRWFCALSLLQLGRWDEGERELAGCVLARHAAAPVRETALFALHRQAVRRGRAIALGGNGQVPAAASGQAGLGPIDDYWRRTQSVLHELGTEFRVPLIATACAEAAWLRGDHAAAIEVARVGLDEALRTRNDRLAGPLLVWLRRLGAHAPAFDGALLPAVALELAGDCTGAARAWENAGVPYERALTLVFGDVEQTRHALGLFERLGAHRAAAAARGRLQAMGVRAAAPQTGPRRATRADPHGLTPRERRVFELVMLGLSNEAIAQRLHRSERTVEHHVSAVLAKMSVRSRVELIARVANAHAEARAAA